jgi:hypothetical protein
MKHPVTITEHALLRYLERIWEIDLDALRTRLATDIQAAAALGAKSYTTNGATFIFERNHITGGIVVATVVTDKMHRRTNSRRAFRMQRERERHTPKLTQP